MGQVFRATDTRLHRTVAIKILPHDKVADPDRKRRFLQEARAASALNHPNIITLHDIDNDAGVDYLVMEYVPGKSLDQLITPKGLPLTEIINYTTQIAGALAAAHAAGVVHRDIKPANVIVTAEGQVKVLDFGLAKLQEPESSPDSETRMIEPTLTEAGMVMGTAAYISPEQARAQPVDARTDLFSLGAVLYEMATGRRPFLRPLDWSTPPADPLPPELRPIVMKLLEVDRELRYQHASELRADLQRLQRDTDAARLATHSTSSPQPASTANPARRWKMWVPAPAAVLILWAAGYFYFHGSLQAKPKLTDKDTIILADFINTTGDPVFDGTLRQGLAIQLAQSPFLSLVSDERIQRTLQMMSQPPDARLTSQTAREICERTGGAAVLDGSIASLGSQYVLGLRAKNCRTGDVLDEEQVQAPRKEDVLNALSQVAIKFRTRVGETLSTIEKHSTPLEEATTPSLEALKAYSTAWKVALSIGPSAAHPLYKRATEIDPKFAMAYAFLGRVYGDIGESVLSAESTVKAYQLRDRVSDNEKFFIAATYDEQVTGNLERARQTYELWAQTYPRSINAHGLLSGAIYPVFGEYEKGIEAAKRAIAIDPDFPFGYMNLAGNNQYLNRLGEAGNALQRAAERKLEMPELSLVAYDLAFVKADKAAMERAAARVHGSGAEDWLFDHQASVLAYSGHLEQATRMIRRAEDRAQQATKREMAALYECGAAVWKALFGKAPEARRSALATLELSKARDIVYGAALALALSGDSGRSQILANDLEKRFPEDTSVRFSYLPVLRALFALNKSEFSKAIDLLRIASPYELGTPGSSYNGNFGSLYPIYVRGLAYLAAHQGAEAATEFQKIIDHPGIMVSDPVGALAHLQLGRAFTMSGDKTKAKAAYQDFLTRWKDADQGIPIFQQAKAESARLM